MCILETNIFTKKTTTNIPKSTELFKLHLFIKKTKKKLARHHNSRRRPYNSRRRPYNACLCSKIAKK